MKKILSATLIGAALLAASSTSFAADRVVTICKVQIYENGWGYISPCAWWASSGGNNNGWLMWDASTEWGKQALNMAMIAHQTANPVMVRSDDADSSNYYDRMRLIRLQP